jgi:hypothetical protein
MSRFLLLGALLLAGCAQPIEFRKPNASLQDEITDRYECEKDTRTVSYSFGRLDDTAVKTFFVRCMMARGWSLRGLNVAGR